MKSRMSLSLIYFPDLTFFFSLFYESLNHSKFTRYLDRQRLLKDDERNTDNAWLENTVYNYHENENVFSRYLLSVSNLITIINDSSLFYSTVLGKYQCIINIS